MPNAPVRVCIICGRSGLGLQYCSWILLYTMTLMTTALTISRILFSHFSLISLPICVGSDGSWTALCTFICMFTVKDVQATV